MIKGFKEFLQNGNVLDLAVAVVIGAAFNSVIERVVESLMNPVIGMFFNADSLNTALVIDLPGGGALQLGAVLGAVLNFVIVAAVVYFVFVMPVNKYNARRKPIEEIAATEAELLAEIRDLLKTQQVAGAVAGGAGAVPGGSAGGGAGSAGGTAGAGGASEQPTA